MKVAGSLVLCGVLSGAATLAASEARADDRAACFDAASSGQTLRDQHKLVGARDKFRVCAQQQCPASMRSDCATWLEAVERAVPTVVVSVKDATGRDEVAATVTMDGQPLTTKLDGAALPVDPGLHVFHFETADGATNAQVLVNEGEKMRAVAVLLPGQVASGSQLREHPLPRAAEPSPRGTIGLVVGGVGVAAIATGVVLAAVGGGERAGCGGGGSCTTQNALDRFNSGTTLLNGGYIVLVGGAVAAAAGLVLWLTSPSESSTGRVAEIAIGVEPSGVTVSGRFR
jgi:hypothetical protein